jgi:hypothetical protein
MGFDNILTRRGPLTMIPLDKEKVRQAVLAKLAVLVDNVNTQAARFAAIHKQNAFTLGINGKPDIMIQHNISTAGNFNYQAYHVLQLETDKAFKAGEITNDDRADQIGETQLLDGSVYTAAVAWVVPRVFPAVPYVLPPEILVIPPAPNPATGEPLIPKAVIDAAVVVNSGVEVKAKPPKTTTDPVFISSATFKKGTDKAANARGAKALAAAAKKAAAAAKLSPKQSKQLMDNVANAIKNNTTSGKKPLAKPKAPRTAGGKPISRPAGSSTVPVTGGGFPLPNGGNGKLPPGAVSSPSPGCFKDKSGNTFCV